MTLQMFEINSQKKGWLFHCVGNDVWKAAVQLELESKVHGIHSTCCRQASIWQVFGILVPFEVFVSWNWFLLVISPTQVYKLLKFIRMNTMCGNWSMTKIKQKINLYVLFNPQSHVIGKL